MTRKTIEKIVKDYYRKYYKDTLGLPNWKEFIDFRLKEEEFERGKIKELQKILGDFLGKKILDVGCGTGGFIIEASRVGASGWGIDSDKNAVEIATQKRDFFKIKDANFQLGKAESLSFPANSFDIVYCYTVLEHVSDVKKSLQEMVRVLKPGGLAYIQTPNYLSFYEGHYKIFWLPLFPKNLAFIYLRIRGRDSAFLKKINYLTPTKIKNYLQDLSVKIKFREHKNKRTQGIFDWPLKIIYTLFNIDPQIELIIKKNE